MGIRDLIGGKGGGDGAPAGRLVAIGDAAGLDAVLALPETLIFKHSPACSISSHGMREVRKYLKHHPDAVIHMIDVLRDRDLSREVESRLGVRHESPQVLLVRDGAAVWHDSHFGVSAKSIQKHLEGTA